ncbi:MAG: hypothetical protein FWD46_06620, partial [Cystobacterineae bacterium]|nr:hypothetical protein [Cystobacterineae bacterium]
MRDKAMGFFQSFISDANRNGQYFKQAEPVERAFVSESPSREMPTDAVNLSDAVFTHLYSTDPSTDVEQNGLSEMAETKHAEQTASKHKTESVLQQAAASIVAPSRQPEIHSESRQQVEPPSTVAP